MECENSVYRNANEVIDRIQVKKKNPRASNENKEEPKIAFFVSTLAVIYTSVCVCVCVCVCVHVDCYSCSRMNQVQV